MIEIVCPKCHHGLTVPPGAMGTSGTCRHCQSRILLPPLWRYRLKKAWSVTWPVIRWVAALPFVIISHLIEANRRQSWRNDPMTDRQAEFLIDLGAGYSRIQGLTKGEASDLITRLKASRH